MKQFVKTTVSVSLISILAAMAACTAKPVVEREPSSTFGRAKLGEAWFFDQSTINSKEVKLRRFNLNSQSDIAEIEQSARAFLAEYKRRKENNTPETEQYIIGRETKAPFNKFDFTDGSLKDSAEFIVEIYDRWRKGAIKVDEAQFQIAQISRAITLKYAEPVKSKYEFFAFPVYLARFLSSPSVSEEYKGQDPDLAYVRQQVVQEKDIAKIDFHKDFDFKEIKGSCKYLKPKRGFGVHAGFQITCGDTVYKMKFGNERYSGPFNTRIYRALGLVNPQINYYETLTVDYDRKLMLEFNERMAMYFKVSVAAIPVYKTTNKDYENPFTYLRGLKMKDGSFIDAKAAQSRLIKAPIIEKITDDMIDTNFESQVAQFVFGPSSLTLKDDPVMGDELGPWVPDDFNYRDFKEIRGLMVLAAWTGNFDIRKDNLRLVAVKDSKGQKQLRLAFGDSGSGLGTATGLSRSGSSIDDMAWEVSSVYQNNNGEDQFPNQPQERINLSGIGELEYAKAFSKIKMTDAQWMVRRICQFTPEQIQSALVSSGLSSAEVVLAQAKLLERRNKMLEHFKMDEEFKLSCHVPVNRKLNYDPLKQPLVTVKYDKGTKAMAAPDRGQHVVNGKLITPGVPQE